MTVNNLSHKENMSARERIQKNKEWTSIENIVPIIEKHLQLSNIYHDRTYESETPDFVFCNGSLSIGIEVTECHPSVQKNNKNKRSNAPAMQSLKERICTLFENNDYLSSITAVEKLNIHIYSGRGLKLSSKPEDVCEEIECLLQAWYLGEECDETNLIRKIRVHKSKAKNIIQFDGIARRDPINYLNIMECIAEKNKKIIDYMARTRCDEYWLCIHLPFEENRQSNSIELDPEKNNEFNDFIKASSFDRIVITSVMSNDINWLKGCP